MFQAYNATTNLVKGFENLSHFFFQEGWWGGCIPPSPLNPPLLADKPDNIIYNIWDCEINMTDLLF